MTPGKVRKGATATYIDFEDGHFVRVLGPEHEKFAREIAALPELVEALTPFAALANEIERCARETPDAPNPENWSMSCGWEDLTKARAALMFAARTQIEQWFKEQGE